MNSEQQERQEVSEETSDSEDELSEEILEYRRMNRENEVDHRPYISPINYDIRCIMKSARRDGAHLTIESSDITSVSVYMTAESLLKGSTYSALGAVLWLGESIIIWIDMPLNLVKKYGTKRETNRIYYSSEVKSRSYTYLDDGQYKYGLSPSVQEMTIRKDTMLRTFGLVLKEVTLPWAADFWPAPVKALVLDHSLISTEPTKSYLKDWLGMNDETEEQEMNDETERYLKTRWNRLN